jgi:hypothetical protein
MPQNPGFNVRDPLTTRVPPAIRRLRKPGLIVTVSYTVISLETVNWFLQLLICRLLAAPLLNVKVEQIALSILTVQFDPAAIIAFVVDVGIPALHLPASFQFPVPEKVELCGNIQDTRRKEIMKIFIIDLLP